jgi:3'-phosphoadenosine 5'-phosphosulfate sulfotransferase (PAPS reductase)/FAD synthetase
MGDVEVVTELEYQVLKSMDGFSSFSDLARTISVSLPSVLAIFRKFEGRKRLTTLDRWSRLYWCGRCRVYLSTARCEQCAAQAIPVVLLPPCDPWFLRGAEHQLVSDLYARSSGKQIPKDALLVGNNGMRNGEFFWQVFHAGKSLGRIDFAGRSPSTWNANWTDEIGNDWTHLTSVAGALESTVVAQDKHLDRLEQNACAFLRETCRLFGCKPLLYFSGGKESVVMLRLLEKAAIAANLVFVGTGVDVPEDVEFFNRVLRPYIAARPQFHLETSIAEETLFLRALQEEGGLDARSPWCRKRIKAPLKAAITSKLYGERPFVALEGSRWYENDFRRSHSSVNWINDYSDQLWLHPIAAWNGLDIWSYITREQLPQNPLYELGFQRTTCWLCPLVNPAHMNISMNRYPELWARVDASSLRGFDRFDNFGVPF